MTELVVIEFPRVQFDPALLVPVSAYGCSFDDERVVVFVVEEPVKKAA